MTAIIIISAVALIILLVVLLLTAFVKIELEYDSEPFVKVKYLFFSRIVMPETKKSIRRKKRKEKKEKKKQEKREKQRRKQLRGQHLKSNKVKPSSEKKTQPVQKAGTVQKAQQTEEGAETKNTDFENTSDKNKNVKLLDKENAKKNKPKPDLDMILSCVRAAKPYAKKLFKKIRIYDVFAEIVVGGDDAAKTALSYGVHCAAVNGFIAFLKNNVSFKAKKIDIKADFDLEKTDYYIYGKIKLRLSTLLSCLIWGYSAVQGAMNGNSTKGQADRNKETAKKAA